MTTIDVISQGLSLPKTSVDVLPTLGVRMENVLTKGIG